MNFATWSIRNPIPVIVLFALLTIAGMWSFLRLPIQDMPDIESPRVNVTLVQPGGTPAQLETEVARPVENALAPLDRLSHLSTTITEGHVVIDVEFELGKPLFEALSDVKQAVDGIRSKLPRDLEEPTVSAVNVLDDPILVYAAKSSRLNEEALSWFLDDVLGRKASQVSGVGRFERIGGVDREIAVAIDPEAALAIGVTPMIVSRALESMQQQLSGGRGTLGGRDQSVRVSALVPDADALKDLALPLPNGGTVTLGEIAAVKDGIKERTQIAFLDGQPAIGFKIFPARSADVTQVAAGVEAAIASLVAANPGLQVQLLTSAVAQTRAQYRGSMNMLYEGGALAMLVVWVFLRDWRATVVAAVSLPLSILPVFAAMALLGFSLNTLTLLALAVTIGILVDDVIVEVENIKRHATDGKPMRRATADAVVEIALVVLATTFCLVCAFLPTTIMPGIPGLLFKQFGWTAIIAVLCSLLVARTLTPMLAAWLLLPSPEHAPTEGVVTRLYLALVQWCLSHRILTLIGAGVFFAASVSLLPLIPAGLIPPDDSGDTTVDVEMAPGTALEATARKTEEIRKALAALDGIAHVFAIVGSGDEPGSDGNTAALLVTMTAKGERPAQAVIESRIRDALRDVPGARFSVAADGLGQSIELLLASEDTETLRESARRIEREMRGVPELSNIRSSASLERAEIIVRPDSVMAAERGIATEEIGDSLRVATLGDFDDAVGRLNFENRQVSLRVRLIDPVRADPKAMGDVRIPSLKGLIPLSSIAAISVESGPTRIDRFDRARTITISADLGDAAFGTKMAEVMSLPAVKALPASVSFIEAGDREVADDLQTGFITAIAAGVACVYAVLVVLFKDFAQPVTILSAIPLSLGGALALLLVSGAELNVPSLIGMVMLIGVVTKNSILLVEYAIVGLRDAAMSARDALVDACRKRARPIVMTTIAMIAGMAPVALGFGSDAAFRQPMALAVVGGLITSTALSLLIVPVVFSCVASLKRRASTRSDG